MSQTARKKTRKFLFQKLYARLFWEVDRDLFHWAFFDGIFDYVLDEEYLNTMYESVIQHQNYCLDILSKYAPRFDIESMNKTNIICVCIGVCEMRFYGTEIPAKVSLNEAVEIAKVYGDDSSGKIVNGILNSYYINIEKHMDVDDAPDFSGRVFF